MIADRWQRVQEIFEQALERQPEERDAFLAEACGEDATLRAEVKSLLAHDEQATDGFMESPQSIDSALPATEAVEPVAVPLLPQAIEGFEIVREIGRGGMGVVYLARDTRLNRSVAIKTIGDSLENPDRRALFEREAQILARLRHPNIVAVHAFLPDSEPPCMIMDLVDGIPISQAARRSSFFRKAELIEKAARAVSHAHERGLVHRDLKPSNILVDRDGEPRILDFGIARLAQVEARDSTLGGKVKGTPAYMAPEQIDTPDQVGPAADVFSLGLILFELLTGIAPHQLETREKARSTSDSVRRIPLPRTIDASIPEPLQRICLKACEQHPNDRYLSAQHLADDLGRFAGGQPIRTRPRSYERLLQDRVRAHLDELAHWEKDSLISRRELDSLQNRYTALLQPIAFGAPGAWRLGFGPTLVQFGGWLIVVSAIIWPAFYWDRLTPLERILSVTVPTVMVNVSSVLLAGRFHQLVALIFAVTGVLLTAEFWLILFGETNLFEWRMAAEFEYFSPEHFCNVQISIATILASLYALAWLRKKQFTIFAATACLLLSLHWTSYLLMSGLKEWIDQEAYAEIALEWLPWTLITYLCARLLDTPTRSHLATPFYAVASISLVLVLSGIAYDAPNRWLGLVSAESSQDPDWLVVGRCGLFFISGVVLLSLAIAHDRANTRLRRLWGRLNFKLVPPFCLISLDVMGDQSFWVLGNLGGAELTAIEACVPLLCLLIIAAGVWLRLRWYIYYGMTHFSYIMVRSSLRFFENELAWPLSVLGAGALSIVCGLVIEKLVALDRRSSASKAHGKNRPEQTFSSP